MGLARQGLRADTDSAPTGLCRELGPGHSHKRYLHVAHRWIWGHLGPVGQLLVTAGLGVQQVGERAQLEVIPVYNSDTQEQRFA